MIATHQAGYRRHLGDRHLRGVRIESDGTIAREGLRDRRCAPLALRQEIGYSLVEARGESAVAEPPSRLELPQGTLDLLILKAIALEPQHGWAISERIQQISNDALQVQQGSLYPALHRLERRGWIKAKWGTSDNNRKAKFYELTRDGRRALDAQTGAWRALTAAVDLLLDTP